MRHRPCFLTSTMTNRSDFLDSAGETGSIHPIRLSFQPMECKFQPMEHKFQPMELKTYPLKAAQVTASLNNKLQETLNIRREFIIFAQVFFKNPYPHVRHLLHRPPDTRPYRHT